MLDSNVENVKSRLSIDDVISGYLKLEKAGSSLRAKCPFHADKSPSFYVSPQRGIYKCFGCGKSGDIFNFVGEYEGLSFPETLEKLAQKAGVVLEKKNFSESGKKNNKILDCLEDLTIFWQKNLLKNSEVKNYLKKRGLDEKLVKQFKVGYAKDSWNETFLYLKNKSYSEEILEKAGIIKKVEGGKIYDRFRNRIIFPIFDVNGKVVAFSGRDFSGKKDIAKYLNSPETIFFNKSEILFGFNFAKFKIREFGFTIVVEGQMDLLMSHKIGYSNSVASSGTSLTEGHLKKILPISDKIVFCYDGDDAGEEASYRGAVKALSLGFNVKVADFPEKKDPADVILKDPEDYKKIIKDSLDIINFYTNRIIKKNISLHEKIKLLEEKIIPLIFNVKNPMEREVYINSIAKNFEIGNESILKSLNIYKENFEEEKKKTNFRKKFQEKNENQNIEKKTEKGIIEPVKEKILKQLIGIYFWQKNIARKDDFKINENDLEKIIENIEVKNFSDKLEKKDLDKISFDMEILYLDTDKKVLEKEVNELFLRLSEFLKKEEFENLQRKLKQAELSKDLNLLEKIKKKINDLYKNI